MYILENDGLPSVGGRTAGQVLSAVSAVRRVLGENQMTLLQFYHPVSFLENLRLLLKGFIETGSTKASLLKVFLRNNHHFKRYLVENAKAEIRRKFKNQESEIEEELLFLKTNPLINDGIKEEYLSFVKNELPKSKKRPLQDYSDPRIFIKQLRDGLDRLATLQDLQTAFAILLNEGLNLRQNEFCALTFNDFDFDSGRYKVRDFNRAVVKAVRGETLVPRNKTNSPIFKNLDPFFNFIIDDLREVAFSSEAFSKFSLSVKKSDDGEKVVILENKTQFQSTFELEGRSLLGFLREEGYSFFRRRLKGVEKVFLLEGGLKTNDVGGVVRYIGSGAFRSAHKSVLGRLGIEYKAPHRRFRADPVTHMLKNGGVTVENTQKIQRAMNWKDHQMVHQYTNNTLDKDEETSLLGDLDEPIKQEPAGLDIDSLSAEERDKLLKKLLARI